MSSNSVSKPTLPPSRMADESALTAALRFHGGLKSTVHATRLINIRLDVIFENLKDLDISMEQLDTELSRRNTEANRQQNSAEDIGSKAVMDVADLPAAPYGREIKKPKSQAAKVVEQDHLYNDLNKRAFNTVTKLATAMGILAKKRTMVVNLKYAMICLQRKPKRPLQITQSKGPSRSGRLGTEGERVLDDMTLYLNITTMESKTKVEKAVDSVRKTLAFLDEPTARLYVDNFTGIAAGSMVNYHGGLRLLVTSKRVTLALSHRTEGAMILSASKYVDLEYR